MKQRLVVATLAVTSFFLLTGFGGRFGCGGTPEERFDRAQGFIQDRVDGRLDELAATDAQRARITALEGELFSQARPLVLSNRQVKQQLIAELRGPTPDAAKLHALVDARAAAYQALAHRLVDAAVEVHGVLTPEQRAKLDAELADRLDE